MTLPRVLDVCCGGRMFWFDKQNPEAVFVDVRSFTRREIWRNAAGDSRSFEVLPGVKADFRSLPFRDESFSQVVFGHRVGKAHGTHWVTFIK